MFYCIIVLYQNLPESGNKMKEGQKWINGIWSDNMLYGCYSLFVQCYNMMETGKYHTRLFSTLMLII